MAYDFIYDSLGNPFLLEISFGFLQEPYYKCEGYWDKALDWHEGSFIQQNWMVEDVIKKIQNLKECPIK